MNSALAVQAPVARVAHQFSRANVAQQKKSVTKCKSNKTTMAAVSVDVKPVSTTPIEGQKTGTSGLRKKAAIFSEGNYLANWVQSLFLALGDEAVGTEMVLGGDGRWFNKEAAQIILKLAAGDASATRGHLTVTIDGKPTQLAVVALNNTPTALVNVSGDTLQLGHGPGPNPAPGLSRQQGTRLWLAKDGSLAADSYAQFSLLNKSLSYTIDLSDVPCSCNAALYFVSMPGIGADGALAPSTLGNYYCDANKVGGVWCFELDTFEGNQHAMQVTAHHCDGAAGEHNPSCDRAGRMRNTELLSLERKLTNPLCPRSECVVDTRMPFRVTQRFVTDTNGTLVTIENSVSQRGASFTFATGHGDGGYLASMTAAMRQGMVLAFQLWGGPWSTMFWLDAWTTRPALCSPGTACPESSRVVYRDVVIASL